MLPFLPGVNGGVAGFPVQVPPPHSLRLPKLPIRQATIEAGNGIASSGLTAAQKNGLRYEAKIQLSLVDIFEDMILLSPTLRFVDANGPGTAIPDAIIRATDWVAIVEIKYQHQPEAWWQLRKKYEPIVRMIYPSRNIFLLEICKVLDASQPFPETYDYVEELPPWISNAKDGALGVYQWRL